MRGRLDSNPEVHRGQRGSRGGSGNERSEAAADPLTMRTIRRIGLIGKSGPQLPRARRRRSTRLATNRAKSRATVLSPRRYLRPFLLAEPLIDSRANARPPAITSETT